MMDQEVKAQWVEALRSGEYHQGTGRLHHISGGQSLYCCLGVLCELAIKAGINVPTNSKPECECSACVESPPVDFVVRYDGSDDFLPEMVRQWSHLDTGNPAVAGLPAYKDTLSWMNDNGHDFTSIANIIEEQF